MELKNSMGEYLIQLVNTLNNVVNYSNKLSDLQDIKIDFSKLIERGTDLEIVIYVGGKWLKEWDMQNLKCVEKRRKYRYIKIVCKEKVCTISLEKERGNVGWFALYNETRIEHLLNLACNITIDDLKTINEIVNKANIKLDKLIEVLKQIVTTVNTLTD